MRRSKVVLGLVAAALSAVMLVGCAGGAAKVGKKYDAVLYAVNEYAIVVNKDEVCLYKNDKQLSTGYKNDKRKFVSIEPIEAETADGKTVRGYSDYFLAKYTDGNHCLLDGDGSRTPVEAAKITKAFVDEQADESGLMPSYTAVAFEGENQNGDTILIKTNGYRTGVSISGGVTEGDGSKSFDYLGNELFLAKVRVNGKMLDYIIDKEGNTVVSAATETDRIETHKFGDNLAFTYTHAIGDDESKTALYVNKTKIEDDVLGADSICGKLVYSKKIDETVSVYYVGEDGKSNKIDYEIDFEGGSYISGGKIYNVVSNGADGEDEKFGIRELGGSAPSAWYDDIKINFTDFDEETFETVGTVTFVNGETYKVANFAQETLATLDKAPEDIRYEEYFDGSYSLMILAGDTVSFDVKGKKSSKQVDGGATLYDDMFVVSGNKIATAYTHDIAIDEEDGLTYDSARDCYNVKKGNNTACIPASQMKFYGNGVVESWVNWARGEVRIVSRETVVPFDADIDLSDKTAREKAKREQALEFIVLSATVENESAGNRSEYERVVILFGREGEQYKWTGETGYVSAEVFDVKKDMFRVAWTRKNGTIDIATLERENDGLTQGTTYHYQNVKIVTDAIGNSYIVSEESGKNAIYGADGTLLLSPKYKVADMEGEYQIANGIAIVEKGDYYGVVKLGKTSKKTKLIKKFEYRICALVPTMTGEFTCSKLGEPYTLCNADGKTVAKNIIGFEIADMSDAYRLGGAFGGKEKDREYKVAQIIADFSDGKSAVITFSLKGSDMNYSLNREILG